MGNKDSLSQVEELKDELCSLASREIADEELHCRLDAIRKRCLHSKSDTILELAMTSSKFVRTACQALFQLLQRHSETFETRSLEDSSAGEGKVIHDLLKFSTDFTLAWIEHSKIKKGDKIPETILKLLDLKHPLLFSVGATNPNLLSDMCRLFELFWAKELTKERYIAYLIPALLARSFEVYAKKGDVKRVCNMANALDLLDLEDDSGITVKHLLLRCFITPLYLGSADGRNFLADLFRTVGPSFVKEIHITIRQQMEFLPPSGISVYAGIYFKAWKHNDGNDEISLKIRTAIEHEAIQDMVDWAVNCKSFKVSMNMRNLLALSFHRNKSVPGVDSMLLRIYNPIIWRSFTAANADVRKNAIALFSTVFPLQSGEMGEKASDELLQRQFDVIASLLYDPSSRVRVATIECTGRILSTFWELIPAKTTCAFINTLVNELVHDQSSPDVREAVFKALNLLLENPLTQDSLKSVLPNLGNMIFDKSIKVRCAVVALLIRIKSIRSIKFYDVVPVDRLLNCLTDDEKLSKELIPLLLDSFYPQSASGAQQLKRSLSLIRTNSKAALAFFRGLHMSLPVGAVCKIAILLSKWVKSSALQERKRGLSNETVDELVCSLQCVCIIWRSIAAEINKPVHKTAKKSIVKALSYSDFVRPLLDKIAEANQLLDLKGPLIELAGRLECDEGILLDVIDLFCIAEIKNGRLSNQNERLLIPCLRCLCLWAKEGRIVDIIQDSLRYHHAAANGQAIGKQGKRIVSIELCMWFIQWMLSEEKDARDRLINEKETFNEIARILLEFFEALWDPNLLECALKLYTHRQVLEMQSSRVQTESSVFPDELVSLMEWDRFKSENSYQKQGIPMNNQVTKCLQIMLCFVDTCMALCSNEQRRREMQKVSEFLLKFKSEDFSKSCLVLSKRIEKQWLQPLLKV